MTAPPAQALSSVSLPFIVPLAGIQAAANAHVPDEFAKVDQTQSLLGGLLNVQVTGTVTRAGNVSVKTDGDALLVSVPIKAAFRTTPAGIGAGLAQNFGGAATVSLRVQPFVTPDWNAGAKVTGDYKWTDPLSVELGQGAKISVQSLVDSQVRAELDKVAAQVATAVQTGADLHRRAGTLWSQVQQPWKLPTPVSAYALVKPVGVALSPFRFTPDALKVNVAATFDLRAGLGSAPAVASAPLPALKVGDLPAPGAELSVPATLPYPELSRLATEYAARQAVTLPVPTSPTLRVTQVTVKPVGKKLHATVRAQLSGQLGLRVEATVDVTGTPQLDASGRVVTLSGVTVQTRREGLSGKVIGLLADSRAQAYLSRAARFDLGPRLEKARVEAQARLPFAPLPGVTLSGTVGTLRLSDLKVNPDALLVAARADGKLAVNVDAGAFK